MNFQLGLSLTGEIVREIHRIFYLHQSKDISLSLCGEWNYYAWPEVFGSTLGPENGIGGQAMSTFTVHAFNRPEIGDCVLFCYRVFQYRRKFSLCMPWKEGLIHSRITSIGEI